MKTIYGQGFTDDDRRSFRYSIHETVIECFIMMCHMSAVYGTVLPENLDRLRIVDKLGMEGKLPPVTEELAADLMELWKDPGIQATFAKRNHYPLSENCSYFVSRLPDMGKPEYLPTTQDILRCRVTTTGMVEASFPMGKNLVHIYDVGGQRNERKKWIHCFEDVTAILFVASLSAYNQLIVEDNRTNALMEGLNLFEDICNSHWFTNTSIILFLNKADIFLDKCTQVPLGDYFPSYTGGNNYVECLAWIEDQYIGRNETDRMIYVHVTTATDTNAVQVVLDSVKDTMWNMSLARANIL